MTEVETFDQASLEAFTSGLVAAGFEPEPGSERRVWKGPIHPAFDGLTDATRMRIVLRDGWPFVFPVLFVDGLHTNHLTEHGYVCLWHEGDGSGQWQTVDGFFARIESWCEQAKRGWDVRGLARDAYLNFTKKHPAVATFDLHALHAGNAGSWGSFHGTVRHPFHVELHPSVGGTTGLEGLWFHVGSIEVPLRNLTELRAALNAAQRRGLDRALKRRRAVEVLQRSSGVDLVMFCWDRDETRHLLVLALSRTGDDVEAQALTEGPNDEQSLLLRAGPDAVALRTKSVSIFGLGALGGHAAVCLASSGVGRLRLVDPDQILPGNVVRHVAGHNAVGIPKVHAVQAHISEHAPWTQVDPGIERPQTPSRLLQLIDDVDLVLDATGSEATTGSLAAVAAAAGKPLVSGGLFRGGAIARVQRQGTLGDVAFADRPGHERYRLIPPGEEEEELVEPAVGCSARAGVGAAGGRRRRHRPRRRPRPRQPTRRAVRAVHHPRARPGLGRRRDRGGPEGGRTALRQARRPRRGGGGGARRRRGRRLVPGAQRVRAPCPRPPQPAVRPPPPGQRGAHERHQGPRGVPPGGPDGAGRPRPRDLRGRAPEPYMLFVHRVRPEWVDRIPAAVHVDGTARVQSVDDSAEPLVAAVLRAFERRTGVPVVVNTSFNTAGRPMVDTPQEALECFGSGPIDLLALGPFTVRRARR